jgi:MFS family permease
MFNWFTGSAARPPLLLKFRSSKTFIILTVSSAIFTDIFVYGIVVPVLPFALTSRADITPESIQTWIAIFLAVYGAALLVAAPICGWLADRSSSRRTPLILGLLALAGSTVMLCVGNGIGILAAGRVLQGISAAVVWVVGLALLVDTVGPDEIGQAMGYVGLSMSLGMLMAPLLGGIVFDTAGYYAVFAMAFGLMVLDIFMRLVMIEKKIAAQWIDQQQTETGENAVDISKARNRQPVADIEMEATPHDLTNENHQQQRQNEAMPSLEQTVSATSAPLAAVESLPDSAPTLVKRIVARLPAVIYLLGSRRLLTALFGCVIQASLLTAFDSILPLYVRDTFNWTSLGAGLIFLPIVVVSFMGPIVGYLSDKHGPRYYAIAGYVLACPFLILLRLVNHNSLKQKVLLCALLALIGFCLTLEITPMMAEITYAVDAKARRRPEGFFGKNGAYAQAYSLFNIAWAAGCMIGPLLGGLLNQAHGWGTATLVLGLLSAFTAIPVAIWTGGSIFKKMKSRRAQQRSTMPGED